jgi:hypothetical protein
MRSAALFGKRSHESPLFGENHRREGLFGARYRSDVRWSVGLTSHQSSDWMRVSSVAGDGGCTSTDRK